MRAAIIYGAKEGLSRLYEDERKYFCGEASPKHQALLVFPNHSVRIEALRARARFRLFRGGFPSPVPVLTEIFRTMTPGSCASTVSVSCLQWSGRHYFPYPLRFEAVPFRAFIFILEKKISIAALPPGTCDAYMEEIHKRWHVKDLYPLLRNWPLRLPCTRAGKQMRWDGCPAASAVSMR